MKYTALLNDDKLTLEKPPRVYIGPESVILDKEEAADLAKVLKHVILPRRYDGILKKFGVTPYSIGQLNEHEDT